MKFRYARHTNHLRPLIDFYTKVIGLEILGEFKDHSNYNGVFLGLPDLDWHIEFTESDEPADHKPDEDDLLVFYLDTQDKIHTILKHAQKLGFAPVKSKNPYWNQNGTELRDPDNFGIILTLKK